MAVFDGNCGNSNGHLNIPGGKTCTVSGTGNTIESITFGANSGIWFSPSATAVINSDVVIASGNSFDVLDSAKVSVNGHLTVSGLMNIYHQSVLEVLDSLRIIDSTTAYFHGITKVTAQDLTIDAGSKLSGTGHSHWNSVSNSVLGLPTIPDHGGIFAGTSGRSPVIAIGNTDVFITMTRPSTYGSARDPKDVGSPGSNSSGGVAGIGGAALELVVSNKLTIDGEIAANGANSSNGAGSGGSINIRTKVLKHSTGSIQANGGTSPKPYGGGGGGRVAIQCEHSEYFSLENEDRPLNLVVQAMGKGQGPGTIWYDCGAYRSTLVVHDDIDIVDQSEFFLNVEDFNNIIIREIRYVTAFIITRVTTRSSRSHIFFNFHYGTVSTAYPDATLFAVYHYGEFAPRSLPNVDSTDCFDYRVRIGCQANRMAHAEIMEIVHVASTALVSFPTSVVLGTFTAEFSNLKAGTEVIKATSIMGFRSFKGKDLHIGPGGHVFMMESLQLTGTLHMSGDGVLQIENVAANIKTGNLYVDAGSTIIAQGYSTPPAGCTNANRYASYAGCSSAGDCTGYRPPYGVYNQVTQPGSAHPCTLQLSTSSLLTIDVTQKASIAGTIRPRTSNQVLTSGGSVRMHVGTLVHMSGTIDLSGTAVLQHGGSGGRAVITCDNDPYDSIFHMKVKGDGGCSTGGCGATGTAYVNCGHLQNHLKVTRLSAPTSTPPATYIIVDANSVLDTIEVSNTNTLYFTSADSGSYQFEVKRVIAPSSVRIEKKSTLRLRIGQTQPPTLPTAASINSRTNSYIANSATKQAQYTASLSNLASVYATYLDLLNQLARISASMRFCQEALDMCRADECGGETTRFTRTGKEVVGIQMNVDTYKNPLDVRTSKETLLASLSNFYGIPESDIEVSDPVESGTRALNVTVNVDTETAPHTGRILLQMSSRIDDSPVETCFKRVNL